MSFDLQIAHSVSEISQETWECLGGGQPFTSYRWYRFGEMVLADDKPVHIVLSRQGRPLARATFWLRSKEPLPISSPPIRRFVETVLHRWPLFMCQIPLASAPALSLPAPPLRAEALGTIAQVAYEQARLYRASFLVCSYLEHHQATWAGWPDTFTPVEVPGPGTRLVINWPDFESYLKDLSNSARKDYRRHRNRAADLGVVVAASQTVTDVEQALVLIRNVERHHSSPPNPWARPILEHANMVKATWLTARIDERLVGCGLLLGEGEVRFLALLGLDYGVQYAYFQLVYAAIRNAIEEGVKILRGGAGAYQIKQRLGFEMEGNNHLVFVGRGVFLQRLGRWLARTEGNQEEPPES
jgi:hypothetical protein